MIPGSTYLSMKELLRGNHVPPISHYMRYAGSDFLGPEVRMELQERDQEINSAIDQTWSANPASIAGVSRKLWWTRQKLYHAKCIARAAFRFSSFFENAFVNRVNRRNCIRMVRFCRSTKLVEMSSRLGLPIRTLDITSMIGLGEYRSFHADHNRRRVSRVARSQRQDQMFLPQLLDRMRNRR